MGPALSLVINAITSRLASNVKSSNSSFLNNVLNVQAKKIHSPSIPVSTESSNPTV